MVGSQAKTLIFTECVFVVCMVLCVISLNHHNSSISQTWIFKNLPKVTQFARGRTSLKINTGLLSHSLPNQTQRGLPRRDKLRLKAEG